MRFPPEFGDKETAILTTMYNAENGTYTSYTLAWKLNPTVQVGTLPATAAFAETRDTTEKLIARGVVSGGKRLTGADGVYFNKLVINHFGGTAALSDGPGGVNPKTLIVRGTTNVAVVDASLIPTIVPAHPVGTIMAVADRAGDILAARWK